MNSLASIPEWFVWLMAVGAFFVAIFGIAGGLNQLAEFIDRLRGKQVDASVFATKTSMTQAFHEIRSLKSELDRATGLNREIFITKDDFRLISEQASKERGKVEGKLESLDTTLRGIEKEMVKINTRFEERINSISDDLMELKEKET